MSAPNTISADKLGRLIGTPRCPLILDCRTDDDFAAEPNVIPGTRRRPALRVAEWVSEWAAEAAGAPAVIVCQKGLKLSHGVAAWLRHEGSAAEVLEGGFEAWREAGLPVVPEAKLPARDARGRTVWVTRARPKIDRIACPWLIRRFVDPAAVILFVAPSEVGAVADRFGAAPFDVEDVYWSHRDERCSFDTMIEELGLTTPPLARLAAIVRGADTARMDLAPQAAGLLAVSLGLSRMFVDDLEQLEAGLLVYDAFYRWCRDAVDEAHNWPTNKVVPA